MPICAVKGLGVCLWAKWINVDKQLDEAFDLMKSWGVQGVKIDFMDRNDAIMVNFYERVARRSGDTYYVAAMSAGEAASAEIALDFLPEGEWDVTLSFAPNGGFIAVIQK
jgi:hypothetical protein